MPRLRELAPTTRGSQDAAKARLRYQASWPPLALGTSSRNLGLFDNSVLATIEYVSYVWRQLCPLEVGGGTPRHCHVTHVIQPVCMRIEKSLPGEQAWESSC